MLKGGEIIAIEGPLGSGKTTLVKGIAKALEIEEEVTSPTYTLISEYEGRLPLHHMDLYRIGSVSEFEMLGASELMYDKGVSVIEWSDRVSSSLPEETLTVSIRITGNGEREIVTKGIEL